jgi:hypothetical protein
MKYLQILCAATCLISVANCTNVKLEEKGFAVSTSTTETQNIEGISKDSTNFYTQPRSIVRIADANIRLATIYKVNVNKDNGSSFVGSDDYVYSQQPVPQGDNWNDNAMPGLSGVRGYNLCNVAHYNIKNNTRKYFFERPVLIKTLYYPAISKDTLNGAPIKRSYFLVSLYDDDTNKDGLLNAKDLRRFYLYNIDADKQKQLIPPDYSVFKSEYDPDNDFMFVFARLDKNKNGQIDDLEPASIFWINLNDPIKTGQQY